MINSKFNCLILYRSSISFLVYSDSYLVCCVSYVICLCSMSYILTYMLNSISYFLAVISNSEILQSLICFSIFFSFLLLCLLYYVLCATCFSVYFFEWPVSYLCFICVLIMSCMFLFGIFLLSVSDLVHPSPLAFLFILTHDSQKNS
jgi:hypothetical protein